MHPRYDFYERCQYAFERAWQKVSDEAFFGSKRGSLKREVASDMMFNWPEDLWSGQGF